MKTLSKSLPLIILMFVALGCSNMTNYVANKACSIDGVPEPKTGQDFTRRAGLHMEKNNYAPEFVPCAFSDLNQAIKLDDKDFVAYARRGVLHRYNKQNDEALKDFAKAIELDPTYSITYLYRAQMYKDLGNLDAAIADMTKTIETAPAESDYDQRAELYEMKGDYENAAKDYTSAIALKSDGTTFRGDKEFLYYQLRAAAYRKLGKEDLAKQDDDAVKTLNKEKYGHVGAADPELKPGEVRTGDSRTIAGGVLNDKAVSLPKPAYPAAARAVKATGTVVVNVEVNTNGDVVKAEAKTGHPMLRGAAAAAARTAKFKPGSAPVSGSLTYEFTAP